MVNLNSNRKDGPDWGINMAGWRVNQDVKRKESQTHKEKGLSWLLDECKNEQKANSGKGEIIGRSIRGE